MQGSTITLLETLQDLWTLFPCVVTHTLVSASYLLLCAASCWMLTEHPDSFQHIECFHWKFLPNGKFEQSFAGKEIECAEVTHYSRCSHCTIYKLHANNNSFDSCSKHPTPGRDARFTTPEGDMWYVICIIDPVDFEWQFPELWKLSSEVAKSVCLTSLDNVGP